MIFTGREGKLPALVLGVVCATADVIDDVIDKAVDSAIDSATSLAALGSEVRVFNMGSPPRSSKLTATCSVEALSRLRE
jgi:hypothetical protein